VISSRLKSLFAFSIPLFVAHGIEEYVTGFYEFDTLDEWIFGLLPFTSTHEAMFVTFQVMFWLLLIVSSLLLVSDRVRFYALFLVGFIYVVELHHPIKAILAGGYYPGLITSLVFPVFALLFFKEWWRIWSLRR
jgi:hypothetical protein